MTEADFEIVRRTLNVNWTKLANELGVSERQLRRYREGKQEVPRVVELACMGLICRETHQRAGIGTTIDPRLVLPGRLRRRAITRSLNRREGQ
jgi:DNA-binding Xre family transcriptional regulator